VSGAHGTMARLRPVETATRIDVETALRASGRTDADRRNEQLARHRELAAVINQGCLSSSTALNGLDVADTARRSSGAGTAAARRSTTGQLAARYIATRFGPPPGPPRPPDRVTASSASAAEHCCDSSAALASSKAQYGQVEENSPFWFLNSTE
jgi:hypothetical protein